MHGTYVDGIRVTSDTWTVISEGSTVTFGDKNAVEGECAKYTLCKEPLAAYNLPFRASPALQQIVHVKKTGDKTDKASVKKRSGRR
jgi:hypothetical protein